MSAQRPTIRAAIAVTLGVLLLSGCSFPSAAPSGSASPSASAGGPSSSPSPSASASSAAEVATIPKDCKAIVGSTVYASTFGTTPLNDPAVAEPGTTGAVTPLTPPAGAAVDEVLASAAQLHCIWRDPNADITYLEATIGTVDAAVAAGYLASLPGEGFTCATKYGGQQCQRITKDEQYPVDDAKTYFLRGTTWIFVGQANFATNGLIGEIAKVVWP
ncbi:hypothetical protein [Lacisediminihabitans changchengi]|uniref:DUF3558 domain-containing protein n=1 Tax=Lacisediminihabitans changchengi TaxID=2787634 RepID=A0A934SKY6_9MICO|nr:hypothetical protein [Lacisediminihabitans changchengi]MBK4347473.1 hypothetical protein [Lacisediminihabitans changchengi]